MQNDILMILIGLFFSVWVTASVVSTIRTTKKEFRLIRKENSSIKTWPKIKAKILKKGYGLDYVYKDLTPEQLKELFPDLSDEDFLERQEEAAYNKMITNGIQIYYGYVYKGEKYINRRIGYVPLDSDIELFYKINKGEIIDIYIDPENPSTSYVRLTTEKELEKYEWKVYEKLLPQSLLAILSWLIVFYGTYNVFT